MVSSMVSLRWLRTTLHADELPREYWYVCAGTFINRLGSFVVPLLALYLTEGRGVPVGEAGILLSCYGMGSLFAGPVGGALADRIGRRTALILALALSAVAMVQLAFARAPAHLAASTMLLGFAGDLYRPAVAATVADTVPPALRHHAYGILYWSANLGFSLASMIAGFVATLSFAPLFVVDAATSLAFAMLVAVGVRETIPAKSRCAATGAGTWLDPYRDAVFLMLVLFMFLVAVCFQQFRMALPIDMRAHGVSAPKYGALIAINGVLIVFLTPLMTRITARFRRSRVLAAGALLTGIGFGANAFIGSVSLYAASIAVWSVGEIIMSPIVPALVADLAPPRLRGSYHGLFQLAWGAAAFAGPLIGGALMGRFGAPTLWRACFVLALVSALGHLVIARARTHRLKELRLSNVTLRQLTS
jgi:MFS family permease